VQRIVGPFLHARLLFLQIKENVNLDTKVKIHPYYLFDFVEELECIAGTLRENNRAVAVGRQGG
jgi:hypothetical protein